MIKNSHNIISHLPYLEFIEDENIFILKDKSLGVIYSIEALDHAPMTYEEIKDFTENTLSLIDLPQNCILQFLLLKSPKSEFSLLAQNEFLKNSESPTAEFFNEKRMEFYIDKARKEEIFDSKVYLSIRFRPEKSKIGFNYFEKDQFLSLIDSYEKNKEGLEKILSKIEAISRLKLNRTNATGLRALLEKALFAEREQGLSPIVKNIPLNEQLLFENIVCDEKGLSGKVFSRTVSFLAPSEHCEGDGINFLSLKFPHLISMRLTKPSTATVSRVLGIKEWCTKNSFSYRSKKQFEEIQETKKKLAQDDSCLHLSWSVTVFAQSLDEVMKRANLVLALGVEKFKVNGIIEEDSGLDILLNSLPLYFDEKCEWGSQRFIPLHQSEVVCFLPIFGSYLGDKDFLQIYETREGSVFGFSPLSSKTSQHSLFIGDTGSGKSFLMNSCLNAVKLLKEEPIVFVFDYNTSQTMNAKLYDGEISRCKMGEAPSVNVFRGIYDDKKVSVLVNWMCEAIRLTSPSFVIETEHKEALSQSVKLSYAKKLKSENTTYVEGTLINSNSSQRVSINMDDVAGELSYLPTQKGFEKYDGIVEILLNKLRSFYGDGLYADYFRKTENTDNFDKKFYVVDFEGIKDDPVLLSLTVASAFEQVRQVKLRPENQNRQVIAVLDEIAELGRSCPIISDYFISKAETSRKDGFWIWGATNRPTNFFEVPVCKALLSVVTHIYVLPMCPKNVEQLASETKILNIADVENILSLKIEKGQFGEFYYISTDGRKKYIGRNRPNLFEYWQTPSNAEASRIASKILKKNNNDALKAIYELASYREEPTKE